MLLKKRGYITAVVERFNHFIKVRQDLFGFIDILAINPGKKEVLGIQACTDTGGQASKHKKKAEACKNLRIWQLCGCKFKIWAWSKKGKAGKRKLWSLREIDTE